MNDIEKAIVYQDKVWRKASERWSELCDALIEYRQTILASRKSDMNYLGYMLAHSLDEDVDIENALDQIREGFEEGKMAQ